MSYKVMDDIGTVEGQGEDEDGASNKAHEVGGPHHAGLLFQQGGIMQWPADGSIVVIGHGSEQAGFSGAKEDKETQLGEATGK